MKFYVVGFADRKGEGSGHIYGDALVYAPSSSEALTKVRKAGWVPNPGDRYLAGSKVERDWHKDDYDITEDMKDRAREGDLAIIWTSGW